MPLHGLSRRQPQRMLRLNAFDSRAMTRFARCFVPRREILRWSPSQSEKVISATFLGPKAGRTNALIMPASSALRRQALLAGVLLEVPLAEVRHRRGAARGLEARQRVAAIGAQLELQPLRFRPCRRQWPIGVAADGVATLPAGAPIGEDERLGASRRDPDAEALDVVVIGDAVATLGRDKPLDQFVGELHVPPPCPRHVHRSLLWWWQRDYDGWKGMANRLP